MTSRDRVAVVGGDDAVGGAEVGGDVEPGGEAVDGDHPAGADERGLGDVDQAHRTDADDDDRVARPEAARARHLGREVEAVGDGEQLGQDGDVGRQLGRHLEDRRAGQHVQVLRPAAEQVGRLARTTASCRSSRGSGRSSTGSPRRSTGTVRRPGWAPGPRGRRSPAACRRRPSAPPAPISTTTPTFSWPWMIGNGVERAWSVPTYCSVSPR